MADSLYPTVALFPSETIFPGLSTFPSTPTVGASWSAGTIISEVVSTLRGFGLTQERVTALRDELADDATEFTVTAAQDNAVGINPGVVEIDSELLYVQAVDPGSGVCTLAAFGRGYQGTVPAAHAAGTAVVSQPAFPRSAVFQAVNGVIADLYPTLFAVQVDSSQTAKDGAYYPVPGARWLVNAQWQDRYKQWHTVRRWQLEEFDDTVRIFDCIPPGSPLRFAWAAEPQLFTSEADDLAQVTGLPGTARDAIVLGAAAVLASGLDLATARRLDLGQFQNPNGTARTGTDVGKYLFSLFSQRLEAEQAALARRYPPRIRRTA